MDMYIYKYNFWRVFKNAWLVYLIVSGQVLMNLLIVVFYYDNIIRYPANLIFLLIPNILISFISVPNIIIYLNYLKYTKNSILEITDESVMLKFNSKITVIKLDEVVCVNIHETKKQNGTICGDWYSWYEIIDDKENIIKICTYLAPIDELWEEILSKKIDSKIVTHFPPLEGRNKWFPPWDYSFPLIE